MQEECRVYKERFQMSDFSQEMVQRVAHLARLSFSGEELSKFSRQLSDIVGYVEKLNELDTASVEPLGNPFALPAPMREDTVIPSMPVNDLLANAPVVKSGHFAVPKVI
jgi:aspartyl-tRNA(Asn)/glutamyl-tRNA(Gln) amidotransferase subunit C